MSNMELWNSICRTPEEHTQPGQNMLTSIKGQYYFMKATEAFGPCGIGWGYEILDEEYKEGAPHFFKPKDCKDMVEYKAVTHTVKIKLWYKYGDQKGEVINYGHTPFIMKSKYGPYQDDDPAKKSLTDAIKKCLSMIGIGADVHLGQFEDVNYKAELQLEAKQAREREIEAKQKATKEEIAEFMKSQKSYYEGCTTLAALNGTHKSAMSEIKRLYEKARQSPDSAINALTDIYNENKGKF